MLEDSSRSAANWRAFAAAVAAADILTRVCSSDEDILMLAGSLAARFEDPIPLTFCRELL